MPHNPAPLLRTNLKHLKLPAMLGEYEKLARDAVAAQESHEQYLLRLTELEVAARTANAIKARILQAGFPVHKDLDTYDFSAVPNLNKQKVLELARGEWLQQKYNCVFIGSAGTGKTHLSIALGLAACRLGRRVRFFTAASLVTRLEEAQKQYQLDRFLAQLDKADLLIVDELGYLSFSRAGAELLFQVFADRYERASLLINGNLPFSEWNQVFQGERMTAALLDRLTHRCHIFEMNGESFRFRESMKGRKGRKADGEGNDGKSDGRRNGAGADGGADKKRDSESRTEKKAE